MIFKIKNKIKKICVFKKSLWGCMISLVNRGGIKLISNTKERKIIKLNISKVFHENNLYIYIYKIK